MGVERFGVANGIPFRYAELFVMPRVYRDFAALAASAMRRLVIICLLPTAHCPLRAASPASMLAVFFNLFRAPLTNFPFGFERNDPAAIPRNFEPVGTMISATISAGGQAVRRD